MRGGVPITHPGPPPPRVVPMIHRPRHVRAIVAAAALPLVALALGACGGGDAASDSSSPAASSATAAPTGDWLTTDCAVPSAPVPAPQAPEGSVLEGSVAVTTAAGAAPVVGIESTAGSSSDFVNVDLAEGVGDPVVAGATVTVEYCGIGMDSKAMFDSSWARGAPATFPLSGVITGWQDGIPGMKPGGRRLLIIPADQAYGDTPPPGSGIEPGESLLFVVDLISSP